MDTPSDAVVIGESLGNPSLFAAVFDRHAGVVFRFLVRRVGRDVADELLGETFRIAFEKRAGFDAARPNARPWLYGIASNLVGKHRRTEARRLRATARMASSPAPDFLADDVSADVDARRSLPRVVTAIADLPGGERDALLLFAWEDLSYEEIADALAIPLGTVRSRLNRARGRLRELLAPSGERQAVRCARPDRLQSAEPNDPWILAEERDRLMSAIEQTPAEPTPAWHAPSIHPRLGYKDEVAAIEFLTRAFGFRERREARRDDPTWGVLAWLEHGDGLVMVGRAEHDIHGIYSPQETGHVTCMLNVSVDDVDAHYERAVAEGARITMEINDAFYGERRYEAEDPEGNRWHFGAPLKKSR